MTEAIVRACTTLKKEASSAGGSQAVSAEKLVDRVAVRFLAALSTLSASLLGNENEDSKLVAAEFARNAVDRAYTAEQARWKQYVEKRDRLALIASQTAQVRADLERAQTVARCKLLALEKANGSVELEKKAAAQRAAASSVVAFLPPAEPLDDVDGLDWDALESGAVGGPG